MYISNCSLASDLLDRACYVVLTKLRAKMKDRAVIGQCKTIVKLKDRALPVYWPAENVDTAWGPRRYRGQISD